MADGPINYEMADPQAAIINGLKLGAGIQQVQAQQQQQQLAQQAALQQQTDLARLASNPNATHADFAAVMTKYPALAEHLSKAQGVLDEGQKQNALNFMTRADAALRSGNTDLAASLFEDRAKADPREAPHWSRMADFSRQAPSTAKLFTAASIAGLTGPEKYAANYASIGAEGRAQEQAPADLLKKNADAATAASGAGIKALEAQNAPTEITLKNETARQGILTSEAQRRVNDFDAQIKASNSETQRGQLTLERDKFIQDQKLKTQAAGNEAQDTFDGLTHSLDLVKSLRSDLSSSKGAIGTFLAMEVPGMKTGAGVGTTIGKVLGMVPGTDAKDFRARLETLKSQQFLSQAKQMKGMGALSDAEGARIERAVASLDADQSPEAFSNALGVIEATLAKGQAKLVSRGQLPKDGGAFVMRHPVYGNVGDADINRLMAQNPGTTREQVLQYLQNTGGTP